MKKQNSSYAQVRIGFYEASLQRKNTLQLVDEFNRLANSQGWTAERSYFYMSLMNEIIRRDINISAIVVQDNKNGQVVSIHYNSVKYDEASKSLVTFITQL